MHKVNITILTSLMSFALWIGAAPNVAACPSCKYVVPPASQTTNSTWQPGAVPAERYTYSILFMMAAPFAVLGTLGAMLVCARQPAPGAVPAPASRQRPSVPTSPQPQRSLRPRRMKDDST